MLFGLIDAPMTFIDHINRVSYHIWTSCGITYTWHFDILHKHTQMYYLFKYSVIDHEEHQLYGNSKKCEFCLEQAVFLEHAVLK